MSFHPRIFERRRLVKALVATIVVLAATVAAFVWWFLRGDAPDDVSLVAAVAQVESGPGETLAEGDAEPAVLDGIEGTWSVDTGVGEFSYEDSTGTFVGFRIEEQLRGIGSSTAVGRTPEVRGTLSIEETTVTAASIEADLSALTTNDSRRDSRARDALETARFPVATFVLKDPIALGEAAGTGEPTAVDATGELTIHGVTTVVTIPLEAQLVGGKIVIVGVLEVKFSDYGVSVPSAPIVVSVEDHGVVELQLFFSR